MNKPFGALSDEEVRQISLLVETLEQSTFDFLEVEVGDLKVTIGKGAPPQRSEAPAAAPAAVPAAAPAPVAAPPRASVPAAEAAPQPQKAAAAPAVDDGTVAVVSPMIGRFYAQPEPGAAPFVSVGNEVQPDTTVALVEVMKVFTAVTAGVKGVVTEVCVNNEQLVEYGQVLFRIRPVEAGKAKAARSR